MQALPWVTHGKNLCKPYLELLMGRIYASLSYLELLIGRIYASLTLSYSWEEFMQALPWVILMGRIYASLTLSYSCMGRIYASLAYLELLMGRIHASLIATLSWEGFMQALPWVTHAIAKDLCKPYLELRLLASMCSFKNKLRSLF